MSGDGSRFSCWLSRSPAPPFPSCTSASGESRHLYGWLGSADGPACHSTEIPFNCLSNSYTGTYLLGNRSYRPATPLPFVSPLQLDYGCIVYGSARRLVLKQLDPIHHQGLRIALCAFRTSPAQSLYTEAHEPSLTTCRLKLSLNCVLKLESLPENPAYRCVFEPENTKLFEESESKVLPLVIRILPHLEKSKLNLNLVDDAPSLDIVPWKLSVPAVCLDITNLKKDTTNPEIYKQLYLQLRISFVRKICHRQF